jgi:hypothetical protein
MNVIFLASKNLGSCFSAAFSMVLVFISHNYINVINT